MIAIIRNRFGKQAFNIVIWITLLSLVGGMFVSAFFRRFSGMAITSVAEVNGYEITAREFQKRVASEEYQISLIRQQFGKNAQMLLDAYGLQGKTEDRVLKTLTTQKLLLSAADRLGIRLSPEFIALKLQDPTNAKELLGDLIPSQFITSTGINYRELLKMLVRQGFTANSLEEIAEERLKEQLVISLVSGSVYIPDVMLRDAFNKLYRTRKFWIAQVPVSSYEKKEQVKIADDVLKKFYEETKDRSRKYWKPEKRSGKVWNFENAPEGFMNEGEKILQEGSPAAFDEFVKKYKGVPGVIAITERKPDEITNKLFATALSNRALGMADKKGFVVEVSAVDPEALLPYEAVKDRVLQDYIKKQALLKLNDDLEKVGEFDTAKRNAWIQEHKGTDKVTNFIAFDTPEGYKDLQKEGIPLNKLRELESAGETVSVITGQNGYLLELVEFGPFNEELFKEKRLELERSLNREETERVARSFIASLEKNAKIKTNKSFFNRR